MANRKNFNFFPKNLQQFFKNIDKLAIVDNDLVAITKHDLQPFGSQLKKLWICVNKIEVITADLFDFTTNLDRINLDLNEIQHVEIGAFDKLKNLPMLHFLNNPCHSGFAGDRDAVLILIKEIESKCSSQNAFKKLSAHNKLKVELAEAKQRHQNESNELIRENTQLKAEVMRMTTKCEIEEKLSVKLQALETKIVAKFDSLEVKAAASDAQLSAQFKAINSKLDIISESENEKFSSINATCTSMDYHLGILKTNCCSRNCRQP